MGERAKRVPTLSEFLADGGRGEGFKEWIAEQMEAVKRADLGTYSDRDRAWIRQTQGMLIAMVEMSNQCERDGLAREKILEALPMAAGFCLVSALSSAVTEDCPKGTLRKLIRQGVREGVEIFFRGTANA